MRNPATILLAAATLPALAQAPGADQSSAIPSYQQFQAEVRGMSAEEVQTLDSQAGKLRAAIRPGSSRCFFIRQVNRNLQKPKEKPELVPLASADGELLDFSNPDCLSDSIVRKPMR